MYRVPGAQVDAPVTGSFAGYNTGSLVGPFEELAGGDYMDLSVSGSRAMLTGDRPPLAIGTGTIQMTYTANLAGGVYEGVSGCFCDVDILVQRTYIVHWTLNHRWGTTNWAIEWVGLWANGSVTGIFPAPGQIFGMDANAVTTQYVLTSGFFILPNWKPGRYRLQLVHGPNGSSQDRVVYRGTLAIL